LSAAGYGFELTVETPSEALVGTTIEVTYHLRNTTDHPSYFDGGASFKLVDRSDPDAQEVATFRRGWDGDLATLPDWIRTAHAPGGVAVPLAPVPVLGQPVGLQPVVCDLMKRPWPALDAGDPIEADPCAQHTAMPAGSTFDQTVTFDLQWGLGALPDLDLRVATGKLGPAGQEPPDTDRLSVTAPLDFQDDPRRLASVEPALAPDAIPAAPTLAEWLTTTRQLPKSSDFFTELIWRNGNWELWVLPRVPNNPVLPIRVLWDADRNQVVDVRTTNFYPVMGNVGGPAAPPEEVRYHVD
jgi:hypothetical protein